MNPVIALILCAGLGVSSSTAHAWSKNNVSNDNAIKRKPSAKADKKTSSKANPSPSASPQPVSYRKSIEARQEEIRSCFEREVTKLNGESSAPGATSSSDNTISRTVETQFLIDPQGKAILIRVTRSIPPQPRVEECIKRLLRQIHFPKPANGKPQEVTFPFRYGR